MNVYSVIHHVVDKLPARDEEQLRQLHDTITAHELGFNSLEEFNEERRLQAAKIDPAAAAAAWEAAQALLVQVQANQQQIVNLLKTAEEGRKAQAETAATKAAESIEEAAPVTDRAVFPQAVRTPADPAPAVPIAAGPSIAELEALLAEAKKGTGAGQA